MTPDLLTILAHWPATRGAAEVHAVSSPHSFSGASVWRVVAGGRSFALRRWQPNMSQERLAQIHAVQCELAKRAPKLVPALERTTNAGSWLSCAQLYWELASWMPGTAEFRADPRPARLTAAMRALATLHLALGHEMPAPPAGQAKWGTSNGMHARANRLGDLAQRTIGATVRSAEEQSVAREAIRLVAALAPRAAKRAAAWTEVELPLQWRLGDVHHDHMLFTGDQVTGVVDLGAVDFDSPAGDLARLIGSLVGDDADRRRQALDEYREVCPMTADEAAVVDVFDVTGTIIATANWIGWLWPTPDVVAPVVDRSAALERLKQLVARLRFRAGSTA